MRVRKATTPRPRMPAVARKRRKHHAEVGDPYAEGADAAVAGRSLISNPYDPNSEDYLYWIDGWHAAKEDQSLA